MQSKIQTNLKIMYIPIDVDNESLHGEIQTD